MALRFSLFICVFSLCFIGDFSAISAQRDDEDMTIKTMEEFSGYPIHEPIYPNSLSSLSVNSESLQKQVNLISKSQYSNFFFGSVYCVFLNFVIKIESWVTRAYEDVILVNSELGLNFLFIENKLKKIMNNK